MSQSRVALGLLGAGWLLLVPGVAAAQAPVETTKKAGQRQGSKGLYERSVVEVAPAPNVSLGLIHIDNRLGNVRIVGHSSAGVTIEAVKRGATASVLDRLKVRLVPDPSGAMRISTSLALGKEATPIAAGSVRIDLVIHAPRTARAVARVWNGRIAVVGMEGGASLDSNVGDIDVKHASGTIVTKSSRGAHRISEVVGSVHAQSLAGNMDLQMIRGARLDASVHRGDITGRAVRSRDVRLRASRGNITLQARPSIVASYFVATHSGDVTVTLKGPGARVWAKTGKGSVYLAGVGRRRTDVNGAVTAQHGRRQAAAMVRLQAGFGDVRFKLVRD